MIELFQYDWRDWFILVADPYNHDKLNVHACEYNSANKGGRYIALASVEKTHRAMSRSAAMHALTGLSLYRYMKFLSLQFKVQYLYGALNVLKMERRPEMQASKNRWGFETQ